jgi:L-seryl-tRNA(Ser) seleniumtransferase
MSGGPANAAKEYPTFESIGVRPFINCRGTYTALSGSLTLPEVKAAMEAAGSAYVNIDELKLAAGNRIGELMQCEFGLVTNGCAAALAHATAGAIAGTDPAKQARLPYTDGMKNEIIIQKSHRFGYDVSIKFSIVVQFAFLNCFKNVLNYSSRSRWRAASSSRSRPPRRWRRRSAPRPR